MTDQLRERIAKTLHERGIPLGYAEVGAQAVIDELGLTVETASTVSPPIVIDRPAGFTNEHIEMITGGEAGPARTRVVGRWEES